MVWRPALLMAGLVAAGLLVHAAPGGASGVLDRLGAGGHITFVLVAAFLCAVGMPRQIAAYTGAYAFGFWGGLALAMAAQLLACAADLGWSRLLGRGWAKHHMERRLGGRLSRLDAFLCANPFTATLTLRLLPVGSNLVLNLLAGVTGIAVLPFLLASAIGYLPQTVVFALLGAGTRLDQTTQMLLAVALFAASILLGVVLLRRVRAVAPA
jgi:uncharacterized membrane protein YdjX (TVP38/TMEM64 family)